MPHSVRSNPHLRLTAAILVAMLAALAGSVDGDGLERTRRHDAQRLLGTLRLVSVHDDAPSCAQHGVAHVALQTAARCRVSDGALAADRADLRASRRTRLDASRPTGVALLRTTALPPPIA